MKTLLLLSVLLPVLAGAQKLALIDRSFKTPISFTDSVSRLQVLQNRFIIYSQDIDSLIRVTERFAQYINTGKVHEPATFDIFTGHSHIVAMTRKAGHINSYHLVLSTRTDNIGTSITIVSSAGKRKAMQKLNIFLDHLRNNRSLLKDARRAAPNE